MYSWQIVGVEMKLFSTNNVECIFLSLRLHSVLVMNLYYAPGPRSLSVFVSCLWFLTDWRLIHVIS